MDIKEVIEALEKLYNRYWSIVILSDNYSKEVKKYFAYCSELSYVIRRFKEIFKEEL